MNTSRRLDSGLSSNPETLSSESDGLSTKLDGLSTKVGALSTNPKGLSAMLANEQDAQRKALLNELPGALAARIGAIGQRHPPGEVCDAIVEVCRLRDWRAEELAILLQRHQDRVEIGLLGLGNIEQTCPNGSGEVVRHSAPVP